MAAHPAPSYRLYHSARLRRHARLHRLHEDDLVGHVLGQENWEIVRLPAIAEEDETIVVDSLLGPRRFRRRRGEALHPAREPIAMLEQIRRPFCTLWPSIAPPLTLL
jgi:hypothetical protein